MKPPNEAARALATENAPTKADENKIPATDPTVKGRPPKQRKPRTPKGSHMSAEEHEAELTRLEKLPPLDYDRERCTAAKRLGLSRVSVLDATIKARRNGAPETHHVPETAEETFQRLADLSPAEYDRCREAEATGLRVRVATLDEEVRKLRRWTGGSDATLQGSAIDLPDVEPWPEKVNGAELLNEVTATFSRYLALPDGAADPMTLWAAHTHCFDIFDVSPRLNLTSPEKGCGKTTTRDLLALFVPRPLPAENLTAAVLFRIVEKRKPTVLADEYDTWLRESDELRGMLNAGHRRGGQALRCEGDNHEVRAFRVFSPAVLCGIGALPSTLHDRSISIRLVRAKPGEVAARFDSRRTAHESELCRKLARWTADETPKIKACDPKMPAQAHNRLADNWRPLFAIAEVAGGDWPRRAAEAFSKLNNGDDLDAQGAGVTLLADIATQFDTCGADRLQSVVLTAKLAEIEGRPWAEFGKSRKPISPNQLATLLRRFKIAPRTIKLADGQTAKGYLKDCFEDAFARYLPTRPDSSSNPVTASEKPSESSIFKASPLESGLRSQGTENGSKNGHGDGVTDSNSEELGGEADLL